MTTAATALPGLVYADLRARHDDYAIDNWELIDNFYEGGFTLEKNAGKYMPRMVGEHRERYKERVQSSAYLNYFGQIVDYFGSALFAQELTVHVAPDSEDPTSPGIEPDDPACYDAFSKNADGKGTRLVDVLKAVLTTAMLKKRGGLLCVDMPAPKAGVASRADEDKLGLGRPYAYELPIDQVIDWDQDDDGGFSYVVIHRKKVTKAPPGKRTGLIVEEFKVWQKLEPSEDEDSAVFGDPEAADAKPVVTWRTYRVSYKPDKPPRETDVIPCVDAGDVSFDRIPILEFVMPHGMCLGEKIVPVAREHYTRRSSLNAGENRSLVSIPYVTKGSEIGAIGGALPAEIQQNPHRGNDPVGRFEEQGWLELGAGDTIGFAEPAGTAYALVDAQLDRLKDEMFRIAHQMAMSVSNNSTTLNRSGASKREDRVAEEIILTEYGRLIRNFSVLTFDTISRARGEGVVWNAHGLDQFASDDREELIEEAQGIDLIDIDSVTFKKFYKVQIAKRLCANAPPETLAQMVQEIEASAEHEHTIKQEGDAAEHEAKLATNLAKADDPQGAMRPKAFPPKPGAPPMKGPAKTPPPKR